MKRLLKAVKEAVHPADFTCDICGRETFGTNICEDCAKALEFNDKEVCPVCGRKTLRPERCAECKNKPPLFKRAVSYFIYEGGVVELIKRFKSGAGYLKEYFADGICKRLKGFPEFDCIVYVPMTRRAKLRRGYNQGELLAKAVSVRVDKPVILRAVEKRRDTGEQKDLSHKERIKNIEGCFRVVKSKEVKDKRVLVVDDVLTTGTTANEMAKVLLRAGAKKVYLATVASVEYKINNG